MPSGPKDGIYWCVAVAENLVGDEGRHFNEIYAWTSTASNGSRFIFTGRGGGANPIGFGERLGTTPPHYPWLVAVDPRGAVLMAVGTHDITKAAIWMLLVSEP